MDVTPEQIEGATFSAAKRGGYLPDEVDRFLRALAQEWRVLQGRVHAAEGANEDLQAASAEMAGLMRDVHTQLGEKRRMAEAEAEQRLRNSEQEGAAIVGAAEAEAERTRDQAERVLSEATAHADLLRNDGEQRVREQAQDVLRSARAELQELLRRKHEVLHTFASLQSDLASLESTLESATLSPDALGEDLVDQTLIDLREPAAAPSSMRPPPPADLDLGHPSAPPLFGAPDKPPSTGT